MNGISTCFGLNPKPTTEIRLAAPVSETKMGFTMTNNVTPEIAKRVASAKYLGSNGTNVVGVGVGTRTIEGVDTLTPCVKFYVSRKPAPDEIAPIDLLPKEILGIPTDVVDVGRAFGPRINARRRWPDGKRVAGPGDSIGPKVEGASNLNLTFSGTFGAVLENRANPKQRFILSNNHILGVNGRVPPEALIVAPGPEDALGTVQKAIARAPKTVLLTRGPEYPNYVDCAIAEVENFEAVTCKFPDGLVVRSHEQPELGVSVIKYGKSSGRTVGKIVDVSADILVDYSFGTFKFVDQILIDGGEKDFAVDGDSGAVVVAASQPTNRWLPDAKPSSVALGLVFAPAGRFAAACPMSKVLESLKQVLPFDLVFATADFGDPDFGAPKLAPASMGG